MATRGFTAKDLAAWLTPPDAVGRVSRAFGFDENKESIKSAIEAIVVRLKGGMITAAAAHSSRGRDEEPTSVVIIPTSHWSGRIDSSPLTLWHTGDIHIILDHLSSVSYFGVRFEPKGINALIAAIPQGSHARSAMPSPPSSPTAPTPHPVEIAKKGGRPPKEWWDDFWVEMCRQIWIGTLKPTKQADLENIMHDWVSSHGHDASVQTIRKVARKLFAALTEEDKN